MDFIRPFLPLVLAGLALILVIDIFLLRHLGFEDFEVLVALLFPVLFGWFLGGRVPPKYWGPYFTLAWFMVLTAPLILRIGKHSLAQTSVVFVVLFATGCMFAAQSVRMLSRYDNSEQDRWT